MLLYGRNSILERLKARPETINKIIVQDTFSVPEIEVLIEKHKIPFERVSAKELSNLKPAKDLQGIVARIKRFEYASFDNLLAQKKSSALTFIFLDRISDPQNLGVIIRIAACFGGFALVIPRHDACEVTEAVLHVASGGENYVPVSMATNLSQAIMKAKQNGYWVMGGSVREDATDLDKVSIPFPLALVLGSEGEGIRYGVEKYIDIEARIPMAGAKLSFNVAMACAIFCHEIAKKRKV